MPTEVYLVKVGMNMTEGVVEEWYIPDGGQVSDGELLYRLETEKVNLDVDAEATGTVKHLVAEGVTMKPGDVVGYIYAAGERIPDAPIAPRSADRASLPPEPASAEPGNPVVPGIGGTRLKASPIARRLALEWTLDLADITGSGPGGRIVEADVLSARIEARSHPEVATAGATPAPVSSPMARKLARELGLSLDGIEGTGPGGRITKDDVQAAADGVRGDRSTSITGTAHSPGEDQTLPLKGMRKTIATRMYQSLQSSAQLTMDMDVRMDDAMKLRTQLIDEWADKDLRPTYTDLVIRAVAKALTSHPLMNSQLTESSLILKGDIHVGMAVALEEGLIVPVIRHADRLSMEQTVAESSRLAAAARGGSLTPDDLKEGTFTVSALGMFGVDSFTPILNSPQAGILGVNRIRDDTDWETGQPLRIRVMRLSLTWDHRVLDGAPAARFLAAVRDLLQAPYRLLV